MSEEKKGLGIFVNKRADKAGAKKAGMSARAWEKSPQDRKADAKGQRMMDAKGKKR